jgi:hypothetical protein
MYGYNRGAVLTCVYEFCCLISDECVDGIHQGVLGLRSSSNNTISSTQSNE